VRQGPIWGSDAVLGELPFRIDVRWAIEDSRRAVVGALRFAELIDSNAPLTVPLASYQTAKSPDNDRFESERCLLTPELRAAPLQSRHNTPLLSH
jgi:hypothetical protein